MIGKRKNHNDLIFSWRLVVVAVAMVLFSPPSFSGDEASSVDGGASLSSLENFSLPGNKIDIAKLDAIKENGLKVGIQGGMIARGKQIANETISMSSSLDRIFQFQPILDRDGFLPPIIIEVKQKTETLHKAQRIEYSGVIYKVLYPARFVRIVPTWRDYLFAGLTDSKMKIDSMPNAIKPKTSIEKKAWKDAVDEGWKQGVNQANMVFVENAARLDRDYIGMLRYIYLRNEGMIKKPILSRTTDGIKVTSDQISIDTGTKVIETPSEMEKNASLWGKPQ